MTPEDHASLIEKLNETRAAFLDAVAGWSEEEAARMPASGWSALQCAEHVATAERGMLALIARSGEPVEPSDRSRFEAAILARAGNRERKVEAPAGMLPNGRYANLAQAVAAFNSARDRSIAYVNSCESDLRERMVEHPIGRVTARECLLLLILHPLRHAGQLRELRMASTISSGSSS